MNGIILIDKEKGLTSRDIVNKVVKILGTKKIGHTGTLDPIATGLMVLCVNEGCKLVELLTGCDKEYIAKVRLGIKTDTYDITGKVIEKNEQYQINKEKLIDVLNSFIGEYYQEVPLYSAIKVNGKKLYEYAREGKHVKLPSHLVKIKNINLLSMSNDTFSFSVTVSSGTYIRSLINDISSRLGIYMTMEELRRTRVGKINVDECSELSNIKIIPIDECLDIEKIELDDNLYKKVSNGVKINNDYNNDIVMFMKDNNPVAIYKTDNKEMRLYRKFNL